MSTIEQTEQPVVEEPEDEVVEEPEDEEPDVEPEAEDEPELVVPTGPQSEREIEKANAALEKEHVRHAKRISEIMGEDALDLVVCEACATNMAGFHWPSSVYPDGSPERVMYEVLSGGGSTTPKQPEFLKTCVSCNGLGDWRTGSYKESCQFITCGDCGGKGYTDERDVRPATLMVVSSEVVAEPAAPAQPDVERDMLGRPTGHPNYGLLPIYMNDQQKALDAADGFAV